MTFSFLCLSNWNIYFIFFLSKLTRVSWRSSVLMPGFNSVNILVPPIHEAYELTQLQCLPQWWSEILWTEGCFFSSQDAHVFTLMLTAVTIVTVTDITWRKREREWETTFRVFFLLHRYTMYTKIKMSAIFHSSSHGSNAFSTCWMLVATAYYNRSTLDSHIVMFSLGWNNMWNISEYSVAQNMRA